MKLTVYDMREDEARDFAEMAAERGVELVISSGRLTPETASLARGSKAVALVAASRIDEANARALSGAGVKYVLTRSTGWDHIDLAAAAKYGLRCANVPVYSQNAVSEYALMSLLALLRDVKGSVRRTDAQDFGLPGRPARELGEMTVGVSGTGFIGSRTARLLRGFGARVLAYTPHPRPELEGVVEYVDRAELFRQSEAIIFHCALTEETRNVVNAAGIASMRDGAILVNAARGELFDYAAVLAALRSGKLGGLAADVFPNETSFIRKNLAGQELDPVISGLLALDNVLITPHTAFYTATAVRGIHSVTFDNLREFLETGHCKNELAK